MSLLIELMRKKKREIITHYNDDNNNIKSIEFSALLGKIQLNFTKIILFSIEH